MRWAGLKAPAVVAVPAPGAGPGNWAGASSAAVDEDGSLVIAYRVRTPDQRGATLVVARSDDGVRLVEIGQVTKERFGAESLERPAVVRVAGGWRLYVSCATPGSKHWRIDVLEAEDPAGFGQSEPRSVFPGSAEVGVKDPVIRRRDGIWHAWICCHPLDVPGEEDRMSTAHATSGDGIAWTWRGTVLRGRSGAWDARGARVTALLPDGTFAYDGRATKEENFRERTGIARPSKDGELLAGGEAVAGFRYLDAVEMPGGGSALFFERPRPDGAHELCVARA